MATQAEPLTLKFPKLDYFDIFSILLWFTLLVPTVALANSGTFTAIRSILLIILVAVFAISVSLKILLEKRLFFYSASWGNYTAILFAATVILSFLLSASKLDSLFGYEFSFASSSLVLISLVGLYFTLKLAGLSLELSISRVFATLPITLLGADILSLTAYLIPVSVYIKILGNYSQYFTFLTQSPLSLLGPSSSAIVLHLAGVLIAAFQIANTLQQNKKITFESVRKSINLLLITVAFSYLVFVTFRSAQYFTIANFFVILLAMTAFVIAIAYGKNKQANIYTMILGVVLTITLLFGVVWSRAGIIGRLPIVGISAEESATILKQSFLNGQIPMWREAVGFGAGTYPYLYLQYRSISSSQLYGDTTFFFKPASFVSELFTESGILGTLAFASMIIVAVIAYFKASSKKALQLEFILLGVTISALLLGPSTIATLTLLFLVLAAFFDKTEALPEQLPAIRAIDIKESLYTNRSISRTGLTLLITSCAFAMIITLPLIPATNMLFAYTRSYMRLSIAQQQATADAKKAAATYSDAYRAASVSILGCPQCSQLDYIRISSLLGLQSLYSTLTEKEQSQSQELQQVRNLLIAESSLLLGKTTTRYDHWNILGQTYRSFAEREKSTSLYTLAIQSIKNSLANNPLSIETNYLYIDILLGIGNDTQVNTEIGNRLATLKSVLGTPFQVQVIEGILAARQGQYDTALAIFEKIKKDANDTSSSLTTDQKKQIGDLVDKRIDEVKKAQTESKKTVPAPTPTKIPTVQTTSIPSRTPQATPTPTPNATK